jgi:putative PIN family toxin of toxin-antitoxin system
MDSLRPGVVFDCNIYLQAISRANGPAAAALRLLETSRINVYLSRAIIREFRRTIEYPEIRQKNPHVTDELVAEFLDHLLFRGTLVRDVPHVFDYSRDPQDEAYIDLAAATGADFLVTRDKDLLCLATDHSIEAKQFRQRFPSLEVMDPVSFLSRIQAISRP